MVFPEEVSKHFSQRHIPGKVPSDADQLLLGQVTLVAFMKFPVARPLAVISTISASTSTVPKQESRMHGL